MAYATKKPLQIEIGNFSQGENSVDDPTVLRQAQVAIAQNVVISESGIVSAPGVQGIKSSPVFAGAYMRGLAIYQTLDGTEHMLAVSSGKLYVVNVSTGAVSSIYVLGGANGNASFAVSHGKAFVCNGTSVVKVEGESAYRVGIDPPESASSELRSGGSLPDGTYKIYAGYARQVDGVFVLYSRGLQVTDRTCGSGNNTIRVTIQDSADAQATHKVVWMTDAGGSTWYRYATAASASAYIDIADDTQKNAAVVYSAVAEDNWTPPAFTFIYAFANRIFGVVSNVVYASKKGATAYDLEKYPAVNYVMFPYVVTGLFHVGNDLYANTVGGIFRIPGGDITAKSEQVTSDESFAYIGTVCQFKGGVIGLTTKKIDIFDGFRFLGFDIGRDIKDAVEKAYGAPQSALPHAIIYRSNRLEYHLFYRDTAISSTHCNVRKILNLSRLSLDSETDFIAPWETRTDAGSYAVVSPSTNKMYVGQSTSAGSTIICETSSHYGELYIYSQSGAFISSLVGREKILRTRSNIVDLAAWITIDRVRYLGKHAKPILLRIRFVDFGDDINLTLASTMEQVKWNEAIFDESRFPQENATAAKKDVPAAANGRFFYLELYQKEDDDMFQIYRIRPEGWYDIGNTV